MSPAATISYAGTEATLEVVVAGADGEATAAEEALAAGGLDGAADGAVDAPMLGLANVPGATCGAPRTRRSPLAGLFEPGDRTIAATATNTRTPTRSER